MDTCFHIFTNYCSIVIIAVIVLAFISYLIMIHTLEKDKITGNNNPFWFLFWFILTVILGSAGGTIFISYYYGNF